MYILEEKLLDLRQERVREGTKIKNNKSDIKILELENRKLFKENVILKIQNWQKTLMIAR